MWVILGNCLPVQANHALQLSHGLPVVPLVLPEFVHLPVQVTDAALVGERPSVGLRHGVPELEHRVVVEGLGLLEEDAVEADVVLGRLEVVDGPRGV